MRTWMRFRGTGWLGLLAVVGLACTPSAPTGISVDVNQHDATISWVAPAARMLPWSVPITSTTVQVDPGGAGATVHDEVNRVTVEKLQSNTTYRLTVTATNEWGGRVTSAPMSFTTAADVPTAPTDVHVGLSIAHPHAILVSWAPPARDGGTPITRYTVTPLLGESREASQSTPQQSVEFDGLDFAVDYRFEVQATNGIGDGLVSQPSAPVRIDCAHSPETAAEAVGLMGLGVLHSSLYRAARQRQGAPLACEARTTRPDGKVGNQATFIVTFPHGWRYRATFQQAAQGPSRQELTFQAPLSGKQLTKLIKDDCRGDCFIVSKNAAGKGVAVRSDCEPSPDTSAEVAAERLVVIQGSSLYDFARDRRGAPMACEVQHPRADGVSDHQATITLTFAQGWQYQATFQGEGCSQQDLTFQPPVAENELKHLCGRGHIVAPTTDGTGTSFTYECPSEPDGDTRYSVTMTAAHGLTLIRE